ncbi:MAG: hypothetical protein D6771_08840, partial [Zetaproteobacteria bacterium]
DHVIHPGAPFDLYVQAGMARDVYVLATDPDVGVVNQGVFYSVYAQPQNGTLTGPIGAGASGVVFRYQPAAGATSDSFTLQAADVYGAADLLQVRVWVVSPAQGRVIYVDPVVGSDLYGGVAGWVDAYATLAHALAVAQPGDEIRLAATDDPTVFNLATNPYTAISPPWALNAPIVVDKPYLTISGGWVPAKNAPTYNQAVPEWYGPRVSFTALDAYGQPNGLIVGAPGVVIERVGVINATNEAVYVSIPGGGAADLRFVYASGSGAGLVVSGAGVEARVDHGLFGNNGWDLYGQPTLSPGIGAGVGQGAALQMTAGVVIDNYAEGVVVQGVNGDAYAGIVGARIERNGGQGGVYVLGAGARAEIVGCRVQDNTAGVVFDLGSTGVVRHSAIVGSSDPYGVANAGGAGIAVTGGAGAQGAPVRLVNLLVGGNRVVGVGVDGYSNATAEFLTVLQNGNGANDPYAAPGAPYGGVVVFAGGALAITNSILYDNYADVWQGAGSAAPQITNAIVKDASATGPSILNQDPYALPMVFDAYGNLDQYASYLPYLSQPTAGWPKSPAIDATGVAVGGLPIAGRTTDIYGALDANFGDYGYHFASGDRDQDMLPDALENDPYGYGAALATSSAAWDTDGDGWSDGYEVFFGASDPADPTSVPQPNLGGAPGGGAAQPALAAWTTLQGAPAGSAVTIQAQLVDAATGAPIPTAWVQFAIQTSPYAFFTANDARLLDAYTDASGMAFATVQDNYVETVPILVSAPSFGLSQTVNQTFAQAAPAGAGVIISA